MCSENRMMCMVNKIVLNGCEYELVKNYKNGFDLKLIEEKYTDYFDNFDYILGDFSYDKVRLKGFYESDNTLASEINSINNLQNYIGIFY